MQVDNPNFDAIEAEKEEQRILLDRGVKFTVARKSIFSKMLLKKERTFIIKQPFLGTLDYLSAEYLKLEYNEEKLQENPLVEVKLAARRSAKICARIAAIAILNDSFRIRFYTRFLAKYLLWRLTPERLDNLSKLILQMSNYQDFISSIRLMSANRTTAPNLMEKNQGPQA